MSTEAPLSGGVQQQHLAALDAGRFLIQRCDGCHRHVYFPRPVCPHCGTDQLQLRRLRTVRGSSWSQMPTVSPSAASG